MARSSGHPSCRRFSRMLSETRQRGSRDQAATVLTSPNPVRSAAWVAGSVSAVSELHPAARRCLIVTSETLLRGSFAQACTVFRSPKASIKIAICVPIVFGPS